jgi:hypothetical protein
MALTLMAWQRRCYSHLAVMVPARPGGEARAPVTTACWHAVADGAAAGWGDSNSDPPYSSTRGQGSGGALTCGSSGPVATAGARRGPPAPDAVRTHRGPPAPSRSVTDARRHSGPPRPGNGSAGPARQGRAWFRPSDLAPKARSVEIPSCEDGQRCRLELSWRCPWLSAGDQS